MILFADSPTIMPLAKWPASTSLKWLPVKKNSCQFNSKMCQRLIILAYTVVKYMDLMRFVSKLMPVQCLQCFRLKFYRNLPHLIKLQLPHLVSQYLTWLVLCRVTFLALSYATLFFKDCANRFLKNHSKFLRCRNNAGTFIIFNLFNNIVSYSRSRRMKCERSQ